MYVQQQAILYLSIELTRWYVRLQVAEKLGKLCRDETFEGTNFYPNAFEQFVLANTEVD